MGRQVVVIGGSGFIGSRLVRCLQQSGHSVWVADRGPSSEFAELTKTCDVRDSESLLAACEGADVIYNLAAEHRDDVRPVSLYDEVNVDGARNVCEVATTLGVKAVVFVSSVAVYGFSDQDLDEDAPTRPFNDYGRTKLEAEEVYRAWYQATPGATLTVVRPTVVFGEDNRGNVYTLLSQLAGGPPIMIGSGENVKSMAYVENVAAFLDHVLSLPPGFHLFNYVDKPDFDMNGLVRTVRAVIDGRASVGWRIPFPLAYAAGAVFDGLAAATGRSFPISRIRIRKFCSPSQFSAQRVAEVGFVPPFDLEQALRRTIAHEFGKESQRQGSTGSGA